MEKIRGHRDTIARAEAELRRLKGLMEERTVGRKTAEATRRTLEALRDKNLETASFREKQDLIVKLGVKVYPSEDCKSARIACNLSPFTTKYRPSPQIISIASPKL